MWILYLSLMSIINVAYCCGSQTCVWGNWHQWTQCNSHCGAGQQMRWKSVCCQAELKLAYTQCVNKCNLTISDGQNFKPCTNNSGCTTVTYINGFSQAAASYLNGTGGVSTKSGGGSAAAIAGGVVGGLAAAALSGLLFFLLFRRCKKKQEEKKILPEEKEENLETENHAQPGA